jgi:hypothetical protein
MQSRFFPSDISATPTEDGAVLLTVIQDGDSVELELPIDLAEKLKSQLDPATETARARARQR